LVTGGLLAWPAEHVIDVACPGSTCRLRPGPAAGYSVKRSIFGLPDTGAAPPWHFSGHEGTPTERVPACQGDHNEEILMEIRLTAGQIDALILAGALIEPARDTVSVI
jgi:hypothetical protein